MVLQEDSSFLAVKTGKRRWNALENGVADGADILDNIINGSFAKSAG
jgi:hypothetical protein